MLGLVEVHSTKLDYENQYRWMLSGLAEEGAALLLRSFAPTTLLLTADPTADASTLYQQVAFLATILASAPHDRGVQRVLRSPHVSYVDHSYRAPGRARHCRLLGCGPRRISPGPRVPVHDGLTVSTVPTPSSRAAGPRRPSTTHQISSSDSALEHWAAVLDQVSGALTGNTPDARRGRREVSELLDVVDCLHADRRLRDVGRLRHWPSGNQVIIRRPGYREIHQAFLVREQRRCSGGMAPTMFTVRVSAMFAVLYEYWCYLELRRLVKQLCHYSDSCPLVELTDDRMHLRLRRGEQQVVSGFVTRHSRSINVELWFNRSFQSTDSSSWSLQMRPDCSLRFTAQAAEGADVETWVHFDAKYRVDSTRDLFVGDDERDERQKAKRANL